MLGTEVDTETNQDAITDNEIHIPLQLNLIGFTNRIIADGPWRPNYSVVQFGITERDIYLWCSGDNEIIVLWRYNLFSRTWKSLMHSLPSNVIKNVFLYLKNSIITYGNDMLYKSDTSNVDSDVLDFSETVTKGECPQICDKARMALYEGYYYITIFWFRIGTDFPFDIYRLHLKSMVWEKLVSASPTNNYFGKRNQHGMAIYKGDIYLLSRFKGPQKVHKFNIQNKTTEKIFAFPPAEFKQREHRIVGRNLIFGITKCMSKIYGFWMKDPDVRCQSLDLNTLTWSIEHNLWIQWVNRIKNVTITSKNKIFIYCSDNLSDYSLYEAFLNTPNLQERCWEAVSRYHLMRIPKYSIANLKTVLPPPFFSLIATENNNN